MTKRLIFLPILAFALVLLAPGTAFACGGAGQSCCSGSTCTAPAVCNMSNVCVLPDQQSCTDPSQCFSGLCADTSSTPTCGSMECLSAAGQACTEDADCEPGTWCYTVAEGGSNECTADSMEGQTCAIDGPHQCVTFICNSMTHRCARAEGPRGCFGPDDCDASDTMTCCTSSQWDGGCPTTTCVNNDNAGWCCIPSGIGGCTVADELTECCSGSCNGGLGVCN